MCLSLVHTTLFLIGVADAWTWSCPCESLHVHLDAALHRRFFNVRERDEMWGSRCLPGWIFYELAQALLFIRPNMLVVILNSILLMQQLFLVLHAHFELIKRLTQHRVCGNFHWLAWVVCNARLAHFHIRVGFGGRRLWVVVGVWRLTLSVSTCVWSTILTSQFRVQANAYAGRRAPQLDIYIV